LDRYRLFRRARKSTKVFQKHLKMPFFSHYYETLKPKMEEETPDEMEVAEKTP